MKKFLTPLALVVALTASSFSASAREGSGKLYGKNFDAEKAQDVASLSTSMGDKKSVENVVVKGPISQVCQAEGCWVKLKNSAGTDVMIKFKDHAFLVPKDIAGKSAVVNGTATKKLVSVAEQRHLAEDAGASKDDIAKITKEKEELRVDATGIIVE